MQLSSAQMPDLQTLTRVLTGILAENKASNDRVTILARERNPRMCTYPSEVVVCQLADGPELKLLCKYEGGRDHKAYGHRGGTAYEAKVYRQVLQSLTVSTPTFYGAHTDTVTGETWLFLEYYDNSLRVEDSPDPAVLKAAARWLGRFHRTNETLRLAASLPFLNRYTAGYYLSWVNRTSLFAEHLHRCFPWLATLCQRFEDVVVALLEPTSVVIHGEYYPNNILFCQGTIYPIDWEAAAVAIGEIDLASLIEGWPEEFESEAKAEYRSARWPDAPPAEFEYRLDVAKLYWRFRWLGERPDWTTEEKSQWRYEQLQTIGERLGLI
jgi:hypothetical protein